MKPMDEKKYQEIKAMRDKNPEHFNIALTLLHDQPDRGFMTCCAFYMRDLNCTYSEAHAHVCKHHPKCFEAFLDANRR
jgi:hypothetical protein